MNKDFLLKVVRYCFFVISFLVSGFHVTIGAAENPTIVIDVRSGKVLQATRATDPWYPASITKLMTVYVALQEVKAGRAKFDQLLTMSSNAAKLPPSKMGFKVGTKVRLDNALLILMVKSANDVAAMIAENLGGSEEAFAQKMNRTARRLGMQESNFVNPHGLPDQRQVVSARDMAILSRALLMEFPQYTSLFDTGAIRFGKRVIVNHNGLLGRYPGANGMKTGFICSSGFNLVGAARRNGQQILTVVLGAPSARERNNLAAELLDRGFSSFGRSSILLNEWPSNAGASVPDLRSQICKKNSMPVNEEGTSAVLTPQNRKDGSNPYAQQTRAFLPTEPEDHPSLAPEKQKFEPVLVWVGLNPPGAKKEGISTERETPKKIQTTDKSTKQALQRQQASVTRKEEVTEPLQLR